MTDNLLFNINKIILDSYANNTPIEGTLNDFFDVSGINIFILDPNGQVIAHTIKSTADEYFQRVYKTKDSIFCEVTEDSTVNKIRNQIVISKTGISLEPTAGRAYHSFYYAIPISDNISWLMACYYKEDTIRTVLPAILKYIIKYYSAGQKIDTDFPTESAYILKLENIIARDLLLYDIDENDSDFLAKLNAYKGKNCEEATLTAPYSISCIQFMHEGKTSSDFLKLKREIETFFPGSFSVIQDDSIFTFHSAYSRHTREKLHQIAIDYDLYVAFSDPFRNLSDRMIFKKQVVSIIRFGKAHTSEKHLFRYLDIYRELVLQAAIEKIPSEALILHDVKLLGDFDRDNNSNYMETLKTYIDCNNSYSKAATELFIDRGTLKYRLNKISQIIECDFDDPDMSEKLSASFIIYEILQRTQHPTNTFTDE